MRFRSSLTERAKPHLLTAKPQTRKHALKSFILTLTLSNPSLILLKDRASKAAHEIVL